MSPVYVDPNRVEYYCLESLISEFSPEPESMGLSCSLSYSGVTVNLECRTDGKFKFLIS